MRPLVLGDSSTSSAPAASSSATSDTVNGTGALSSGDWSKNSNSFINKPTKGWLHSDQKLSQGGICYTVQYVGCCEVKASMKSLDFETRSLIAKECINRVVQASSLNNKPKPRDSNSKIDKMLADRCNMQNSGEKVNLTITSSYLNLALLDTAQTIARHEMPNISFASGGDADTTDYVAYVAKDTQYGRACFVLECASGLAQDVITTVGQAFELRFKQFLKRAPRINNDKAAVSSPTTLSTVTKCQLDEKTREYYNDLPGKVPPESTQPSSRINEGLGACGRISPQAAPRSVRKNVTNNNSGHEELNANLIDLTDPSSTLMAPGEDDTAMDIFDSTPPPPLPLTQPPSTNGTVIIDPITGMSRDDRYVNCKTTNNSAERKEGNCDTTHDNKGANPRDGIRDPFDMKPFDSTLLEEVQKDGSTFSKGVDSSFSAGPSRAGQMSIRPTIESERTELRKEVWFHGPISRKESETLVVKDGDFLVRESLASPGQFVLTGMQSGVRKHLLLVDPQGMVRTKDKTFDSVSHLINFHRDNNLPIISAESVLLLKTPIKSYQGSVTANLISSITKTTTTSTPC